MKLDAARGGGRLRGAAAMASRRVASVVWCGAVFGDVAATRTAEGVLGQVDAARPVCRFLALGPANTTLQYADAPSHAMPRVVLALAATTALVATTTCVAAAATPADAFDFRDAASTDGPTPLLWLPLGDSITFGCGNSALPRQKAVCVPNAGGYRVPLAWTLAQLNYNVSTMGTLTNGGDDTPPQWHHHEGHPGWRWDQVDDILDQSLETSPTPPDLVTIHLGTNDCGQGADLPTLQVGVALWLVPQAECVPDLLTMRAYTAASRRGDIARAHPRAGAPTTRPRRTAPARCCRTCSKRCPRPPCSWRRSSASRRRPHAPTPTTRRYPTSSATSKRKEWPSPTRPWRSGRACAWAPTHQGRTHSRACAARPRCTRRPPGICAWRAPLRSTSLRRG